MICSNTSKNTTAAIAIVCLPRVFSKLGTRTGLGVPQIHSSTVCYFFRQGEAAARMMVPQQMALQKIIPLLHIRYSSRSDCRLQ